MTTFPSLAQTGRSLVATGLLAGAMLFTSSSDAQAFVSQATCTGEVPNGWTFSVDVLDDRFLHVIWSGPQGQARVTLLDYYATNAEEFPVFNGTLQDTIEVLLVDESGGAPGDGTEIVVFTEDWGWMTAPCRALSDEAPVYEAYVEAVRQKLMGTRDTRGTNWLRSNGFTLTRNLENTRTGKIERWTRSTDRPIDVTFYRGFISDVSLVTED